MKKTVALCVAIAALLTCASYASAYVGEGIVLCTNLNVRPYMNVDLEPVITAHQGDVLTILAEYDSNYLRRNNYSEVSYYDWYEVAFKGYSGYVLSDYVMETNQPVHTRRSETHIFCMPDQDSKCIAELASDYLLYVIDEWGAYYCVYMPTRKDIGFVPMNQVR